jgi:hypothetical protein
MIMIKLYKQTAIDALLNQASSGKIKTDAAKVLNHVQKHDKVFAMGMSSMLDMPIRTASARLNQLEDQGLIEPDGTVEMKGSSHTVYKAVSCTTRQKQLRELRFRLAHLRWLKRGESFANFHSESMQVELLAHSMRSDIAVNLIF